MITGLSVGRRLFFLVAIQTLIAFLLVLLAVRTLSRAEADYRHMYDFQFKAVAAIGHAMAEAEKLEPGTKSSGLDHFYRRYRSEWETASGVTPDAIRFRKDLQQAGATYLSQLETELLTDLKKSLDDGNADNVRNDLAALHTLNIRYAQLENNNIMERTRSGRMWLVVVGLTGIGLILFLGLHVRRAVAPRVKHLVGQVRSFQETGKYERIVDNGKDDIAVLANALDVGFSAIALRDRQRQQFLTIAAHELKTPVTSIHGYASLLVNSPPPEAEYRRALSTINRQSWRLSRLIDALFLASQARSGKLDFQPQPFDMSELVERVLADMAPVVSRRSFKAQIEKNVCILGDETLLEHALWSLFTCGVAYSTENEPLQVTLHSIGHRVKLAVAVTGASISAKEVEELFMPFGFVEYETGSGARSAIGLYLCREIVRLHNGSLSMEQTSAGRSELVMELAK